ncbi:MAG: LamG-like jellyroll fold domain-containing protein [Bacteroidia bacterium]
MKTVFSAFVLILIGNMVLGQSIPTSKLYFHAPFDSDLNDVISNIKGKNYGATPTKNRFNQDSSAWYFDGTNDWADYGTDIQINDIDSLTFSVWVQPGYFEHPIFSSKPSGRHTIIGDAANGGGFRFVQYKKEFHFQVQKDGTWRTYGTQSDRMKHSWSHLVGVCDNGFVSFYINGELVDTADNSWRSRTLGKLNFEVARGTASNNTYWQGKIDDVRIYNSALSAGDVMDLFEAESIASTNFYDSLTLYDTIKTYDTVLVKNNIYDTIQVFDTTNITNYINDTVMVYDTVLVKKNIYDTVAVYDTIWLTKFDTTMVFDTTTIIAYDTVWTFDTATILTFDTVWTIAYDTITVTDTATILTFDTLITTVYDTIPFWDSVLSNDTLAIAVYTSLSPQPYRAILLYPNPATSQNENIIVEVPEFDGLVNHNIYIVNQNGQIVWSQSSPKDKYTIPVKDIGGSGTYFIRIINENGYSIGQSTFVITVK